MGIFNIFKKGNKETKSELSIHPDILLSEIDNGSHGDNIGALIGFENLNTEEGQNFINEYVYKSVKDSNVLMNNKYSISNSSLTDEKLNNNTLGLRVLRKNKNVVSAYPYLRTDYIIPFSTKEIIEWTHVNKVEAEIKGGGRDTFGFDFFPTDYAINKAIYLEKKEIKIYVSAFALVLDESNIDENEEQKFSKDFVAYMPSSNLQRQTYYDFIGEVVEYKEIELRNFNKGYIAKVRLINDDSDPEFFTIDMFINKNNMRIPEIEKGMKITGLLWFQGELA